jgi:hypothetical protein
MPSLLHIPKMMMNATTTLQPTVEYSTRLHNLFFLTPLLLMFFSTISLPPPPSVYAHSSTILFLFLFFIVFQSHSCFCDFQNFENAHNFGKKWKPFMMVTPFFPFLNFPLITFILSPTQCLLINTWSSKLIQPITTIFCVLCIATWRFFVSSLWMNDSYFIFR